MQVIKEAPAIEPKDGDVWVDTALRSDIHNDGVHWHARLDGRGRVELFEPGGPGLIPAADVSKMRGGMKLLRNRPQEFGDPLGWAGAPWGAIVDGYQKIDTTWHRIDRTEDIDLDALRQSRPTFARITLAGAIRLWRESIDEWGGGGPDHSPGAAVVLPGITCTIPGHCGTRLM